MSVKNFPLICSHTPGCGCLLEITKVFTLLLLHQTYPSPCKYTHIISPKNLDGSAWKLDLVCSSNSQNLLCFCAQPLCTWSSSNYFSRKYLPRSTRGFLPVLALILTICWGFRAKTMYSLSDYYIIFIGHFNKLLIYMLNITCLHIKVFHNFCYF